MPKNNRYTPAKRGYFVSAEEEKAVKEGVLYDYFENRKIFAALLEKAHRLGTEFEGLANMLKKDVYVIRSIALEAYQPLLSKETLDKIAQLQSDLWSAEQEMGRLNDRMRELGYGDMLSHCGPLLRT